MGIDRIDERLNSPLRVLSVKDAEEIRKDLSALVLSQPVWADGSGHIHQRVTVVGLLSALEYVIVAIHELICGITLDNEFLVVKSKEILDQYIAFLLENKDLLLGAGPVDVARIRSIYNDICALELKVVGNKTIFAERKEELQRLVTQLQVGQHFSSACKTARVSSGRFAGLPLHKRFLLLSPYAIGDNCFTREHVEMVRRVVTLAPKDDKQEVAEHAARYLCAMEKTMKKSSIAQHISFALETLPAECLVKAAIEFKHIPSALNQHPEALAEVLLGLIDGADSFAVEVATQLAKSAQMDQFIENQAKHLNNPETQEKYLKRILFLQSVCSNSPRIEAALADLEYLALHTDLSENCVRQLLPRGQLTRQLTTSFLSALELPSQERVKVLKELLPIAMNLYAKTSLNQFSELIDEIGIRLFENGSNELTEAIFNSAIADALQEESVVKLEKLLRVVLVAKGLHPFDDEIEFFTNRVIATLNGSKQGPAIIAAATEKLMQEAAENQLAITSLSLLNEAAFEQSKKVPNLNDRFTRTVAELLSFENGYNDLEKMIRAKIRQLGRETDDGKLKSLRAYLGFYRHQFRISANTQLRDLSNAIGTVLSSHALQSVALKQPHATKEILQDLDKKVLDYNLAKYLYNPDGSLAQKPM
jgi:hypothetical protein